MKDERKRERTLTEEKTIRVTITANEQESRYKCDTTMKFIFHLFSCFKKKISKRYFHHISNRFPVINKRIDFLLFIISIR